MLNLSVAAKQVDEMAEHLAAERGIHVLPKEELGRILAEFQTKHHVQFTRETFTLHGPTADGTFVLAPDGDDPLPAIGCRVEVHGYSSQTWHTVVVDIDEAVGTYTAQVVDIQPKAGVKRSRFGDDHMAAMYDGGRYGPTESTV